MPSTKKILNPKSGRFIAYGGALHKRLIKSKEMDNIVLKTHKSKKVKTPPRIKKTVTSRHKLDKKLKKKRKHYKKSKPIKIKPKNKIKRKKSSSSSSSSESSQTVESSSSSSSSESSSEENSDSES